MTRLSPLIPENGLGIKRNSLLCISDFIFWLKENEPDVFTKAIKVVGKDCKAAFNDLEDGIALWRK